MRDQWGGKWWIVRCLWLTSQTSTWRFQDTLDQFKSFCEKNNLKTELKSSSSNIWKMEISSQNWIPTICTKILAKYSTNAGFARSENCQKIYHFTTKKYFFQKVEFFCQKWPNRIWWLSNRFLAQKFQTLSLEINVDSFSRFSPSKQTRLETFQKSPNHYSKALKEERFEKKISE